MLWTIALVLLVLWALGLVSSFTIGGFIHILLVAAVVLVLVSVIQGRRVVCPAFLRSGSDHDGLKNGRC